MKFKRIAALMLVAVMVILSCHTLAFAESEEDIKLYIDNTLIELENPCLIDNGIVYIPMEEVFFKVGVYMEWSEKDGCYIGNGNNGEIRIYIGDKMPEVDWVALEIPGPVKMINGVCMIPLYLAEDALKIAPPIYDEATKSIYMDFPNPDETFEMEFDLSKVINTLPEPIEDLIEPGQMFDIKTDESSSDSLFASRKIEISDPNLPFTEALEIETLPSPTGQHPTSIYSVQKDFFITKGFGAYDVGIMTFWARATKITDEGGVAYIRPCFERISPGDDIGWHKAQGETIAIGPEWKQYFLICYTDGVEFKPWGSHFTYSVGAKPQIIQFADLHIYNYGTQVTPQELNPEANRYDWKGIEEDALWRKEAWKRVEKYRKNDLLIEVTDEEGKPVEGAEVTVDLTEHEYMLGMATLEWETQRLWPDESEIGRKREYVLSLVNTITPDGFPKGQEKVNYNRVGMRSADIGLDYGLRLRGHCLTWSDMTMRNMDNYKQGDVTSLDYEHMRDYLLRNVAAAAWAGRDIISTWDVLNEPHDSNAFRLQYGTDIFSEAFKIVKAVDPKAKLIVNETGINALNDRFSHSLSRVFGLQRITDPMKEDERAPIDGLGVQAHSANMANYPQGWWWIVEDMTNSGKYDTVEITEWDYYNENTERYMYETEFLRDNFLAWFSHPKSDGFVMWGYHDPNHWRRYGPFYTQKWEEKAQLKEWVRMFEEEYNTYENTTTDSNGKATVRGYRGKYDVTVNVNGKKTVIPCMIANSDNTQRDNFVKVVVAKDGKISYTVSNPQETYAKRRVEYDNIDEAYADYLIAGADKWIGIYTHSDSTGNRVPDTSDGLMNTFWYGGDGEWCQYELVEKARIGNVNVDFRAPLGEVYNYEIQKSLDGENWSTIYKGTSDEDVTVDFENAMYIRIVSTGNDYMGISEVNIHAEK